MTQIYKSFSFLVIKYLLILLIITTIISSTLISYFISDISQINQRLKSINSIQEIIITNLSTQNNEMTDHSSKSSYSINQPLEKTIIKLINKINKSQPFLDSLNEIKQLTHDSNLLQIIDKMIDNYLVEYPSYQSLLLELNQLEAGIPDQSTIDIESTNRLIDQLISKFKNIIIIKKVTNNQLSLKLIQQINYALLNSDLEQAIRLLNISDDNPIVNQWLKKANYLLNLNNNIDLLINHLIDESSNIDHQINKRL